MGFSSETHDGVSVVDDIATPLLMNATSSSPYFTAPSSGAAAAFGGKITPKVRADCWMLHVGPHKKEDTCMFCGKMTIRFTENSGWECSHIVAEKFASATVPVAYNVVPACAACNNAMGTRNALDILWDAHKVDALKRICANVFNAFVARHGGDDVDHIMWRLVCKLYGSDEHAAGGGISCMNEKPIYDMLACYQTQLIRDEMDANLTVVSRLNARLEMLVRTPFKPSKRARLFG